MVAVCRLIYPDGESAPRAPKSSNPACDEGQLVSPAAEPKVHDAECDAEAEVHRRIVEDPDHRHGRCG